VRAQASQDGLRLIANRGSCGEQRGTQAIAFRSRTKLAQRRRSEGRISCEKLYDDDPAGCGLVPPACQRRGGRSESKADLAHPADLSPGCSEHRGAIFIALPRLLPHVTSAAGASCHARPLALTPRAAIEKFRPPCSLIDLHIPTTEGPGEGAAVTHPLTEPEPEPALLIDKLKCVMPAQPEAQNQRRSGRHALRRE